ncbi:MAG: 16S rRNA (cytidine(1402)-2'-O)-methyltransferase [Gemmobacter sp.]|nr:16S rRNA (cytidine(1402)-2'-O)-methyltransferase [Gemmobacter sp.]
MTEAPPETSPEDGPNAGADLHAPAPTALWTRARAIPAGLHLIATPIGAARDITLRALDILAGADVLAAEDTRTLRHLMEIHGIPLGGRALISYHEHNDAEAGPRLLRALADGRSVAYASEAGTPLVADPGYQLARDAIAAGNTVLSAPGPSAVLAALTVSGLPTDRFLFAGFAPAAAGARGNWLADLAEIKATIVIYESPKRVGKLLGEMVQSFGKDRRAAVCRELTKRFEEVKRGTLAELADDFSGKAVKGEIVLVIDRPAAVVVDAATVEAALLAALGSGPVKEVAARLAGQFGLSRREVYQMALRLEGKD